MIPSGRNRWLLTLLFVIIPANLAAQMPQPQDGATEISNSPKLSWTKPAGAEKYDVTLNRADVPNIKFTELGLKANTFRFMNTLTAGAEYQWRVDWYDSTGKMTTGTIWTFTVSGAPVLPGTGGDAGNALKNLGFGLALSLQWNILKPDIVNDAVVDVNGIVRVNTRTNTSPGFMLEMHYLVKQWNNKTVGTGPFVAAQPGTDQIISSVGAGWMIDWKVDENSKKGFGLGLGYAARPFAKTLGDEFVDGKPAPLGPNGLPLQIRYETRDKGSILAVLSFTF